jgi:hypothetical protein
MAYFISSYRSPDQLRRLLATLRAADEYAELIVHHDSFQSELDPSIVTDVAGHLLTSPFPIVWGDMSLERARWRVLDWALQHIDFDWIVLLSEQDYPITPSDVLAHRLRDSGADAVLEAEPIARMTDPFERLDRDRRYGYQYATLPASDITAQWPRPLRDAAKQLKKWMVAAIIRSQRLVFVYRRPPALTLPSMVGIRVGRRSPFSGQFPCWWGSAWYALSRRGTQRLLELIDANPQLVQYFARTVIPVESATATLLSNADDVRVENASLHHIRWTDRGSGRPDVFTMSDLAELLDSGCYFARKFDLSESAILDQLDQYVLAHQSSAHPPSQSGIEG